MKLLASSSFNLRKKRGFTLMEMMITMVIFVLLAAAAFGIMVGTLKSTAVLQDDQDHRDQMAALRAFLKKQMSDLGAQRFLVSYRRGNGEGLAQNGIAFGGLDGATVIDAKAQPNGYYQLRLGEIRMEGLSYINDAFTGFKLPSGVTSDNEAGVQWAPLIRDVRRVDWKFMDANSGQWADDYFNLASPPDLMELSIQLAGDLRPTTMDFWFPHLSPMTSVAPQAPGLNPAKSPSLANGAAPANGENPANGTTPTNPTRTVPANGTTPANNYNPNSESHQFFRFH